MNYSKVIKVTATLMLVSAFLNALSIHRIMTESEIWKWGNEPQAGKVWWILGMTILTIIAHTIAGVNGLRSANWLDEMNKCLLWGGISMAIYLTLRIVFAITVGVWGVSSMILPLVIHGLYLYSAYRNRLIYEGTKH